MSNKAIFLDRDDTLIEDPGYINHPDQVKLLDGVAEALIEFKAMGYKLIVVSNQSGVARGIVTEKVLDQIHNRLKQLLAKKGAHLDKIYYCPYHPDGDVAKYRKESDWRKPKPGMLLAAADEIDIDFEQSWAIGNSSRDIEAGSQVGCKTILIEHHSYETRMEPNEPKPDHRAVNIKEAVNIIKKYHRSSGKSTIKNQPSPTPKTTLQETEQPQSKLMNVTTYSRDNNVPDRKINQLLENILKELKSIQRANMFSEFSTMRLIAAIVQIAVLFCLLISIWHLISPTRQNSSVFITLGFAVVLQVMALTFYIMQGRK